MMFMVSDAEERSIKDANRLSGEFAAMLEFRRLFPGIEVIHARECVRTIVGWKAIGVPVPGKRVRRRG